MEKLKDYSTSNIDVYVGELITTNLGSLVVHTLTKDENSIHTSSVKIEGNSFSILRLFKLTSSVNNQIIFSQKGASEGVSVETDGSGYLISKINNSTLFSGKVKLELNKVYASVLTYDGRFVTLKVNNGSEYSESFSDSVIESSEDAIINLTGQSGIIFCSSLFYSDIKSFASKIYYLATHYKIVDSNNESVGVGESLSGTIPSDSASLFYKPLKNVVLDDIDDVSIDGDLISFIAGGKFIKMSYKSSVVSSEIATTQTKLVSSDSKTILFGSGLFGLKLTNPSSGRVLGYTRKVNGSNYDHKFYVDFNLVDSFTSSDEFAISDKCSIPIDVSGTILSITPSKYVLDYIILDDEEYAKDQFRTFFLADEIIDNPKINPKIKIAGVQGFSNQIIYSVEDVLKELGHPLTNIAEANSGTKIVTKYIEED